MKYMFGWTGKDCYDNNGTEKAWGVTVAGGATTINDRHFWIPRSIIKCDEPNEFGNMKVYIPLWFYIKNKRDCERIREIDWGENGVSPLVEL